MTHHTLPRSLETKFKVSTLKKIGDYLVVIYINIQNILYKCKHKTQKNSSKGQGHSNQYLAVL